MPAHPDETSEKTMRLATGRRRACHMHTPNKTTHTRIPHIAGNCQPGRQLCCVCCAALCALLCCAVMWLLHPLSASPVFQRGGPPWPPILFLTSHSIFSLLRRSFLPCLLVPLCLPARGVFSRTDRAGKCEPLPSGCAADELIQQWQAVGEKACQSGPAVPQPSPSSWPCLMRP